MKLLKQLIIADINLILGAIVATGVITALLNTIGTIAGL